MLVFGPLNTVLLRFTLMQSFSTKPDNFNELQPPRQTVIVRDGEELTPGCSATIDLPDGGEVALFSIDGEFYATR